MKRIKVKFILLPKLLRKVRFSWWVSTFSLSFSTLFFSYCSGRWFSHKNRMFFLLSCFFFLFSWLFLNILSTFFCFIKKNSNQNQEATKNNKFFTEISIENLFPNNCKSDPCSRKFMKWNSISFECKSTTMTRVVVVSTRWRTGTSY